MPEPGADEEGLTLEVSADDAHSDAVAKTSRALLAHPTMRHEFPAGDLWLVWFDTSDKAGPSGREAGGGGRFVAQVHDTASGRSLSAHGHLDDPATLTVTPTSHQRPPTDEEFAWAVATLAEHGEIDVKDADGGGLSTYRPLPPLANVANADGTVDRVVTVGIRSEAGGVRHRVLGVRAGDGAIVREPAGVPQPSADDCGVPPGADCAFASGPGQVRVRLSRGEAPVWDLVVVRPSASSGTNGSGVELRQVDYKGQRVLARAHVPIVNVQYPGDDGETREGSSCGPTYRCWGHEESCYDAPGSDAAPGFRICSAPPVTVLESGTDGGDFRGVAFWLDGDELVIVSQLQAGWYRYVSEWRLGADGTIRPRFGVAAARNPCTCVAQTHHAYWRFDFDILGHTNNLVQEYNDPPVLGTGNWHTTRYEVRRPRAASSGRYWRVRNVRSSQGYSLVPGTDDGAADDYGVGDVWILRHRESEIDDGHGFTADPALSRAHLDRFVSSESVERQDVVLWYAGHLVHDGDAPGHRVGPDLVPSHWRDLTTPEPFAPLEPPPAPS